MTLIQGLVHGQLTEPLLRAEDSADDEYEEGDDDDPDFGAKRKSRSSARKTPSKQQPARSARPSKVQYCRHPQPSSTRTARLVFETYVVASEAVSHASLSARLSEPLRCTSAWFQILWGRCGMSWT